MAANLTGNSQTYGDSQIRIFQGLKPDVICIQEFNYLGNSAAEIRAFVDTAFGASFQYTRETNGSYNIPNGVISRYPISAAGSWDDSQSPNRGFAWARIKLPGTNELLAVSVHLLTSDSATRGMEAAELRAILQTNVNVPPSGWIVVGGDFNTDNRGESAISTLTNGNFLRDTPIPTDGGGDPDTNLNRNKPYDYALPSSPFAARLTSVVIGASSFPNGLVFDSRVYANLAEVSPVQLNDSANGQHMAILKDFLIPTSGSTTGAPSITTQPQSQTNFAGANVVFSVIATGTDPLSYQWRHTTTNLPGATASSLSLTNIQSVDAGNYSVVVTNIAGSVTSSIATLTITIGPAITNQPQSLSVLIGQDAAFTVGAAGAGTLSYQWRFSAINIPGATNAAYTRTNAQPADAGNYTVVVTNSSGSITSSVAVLTINEPATGTITTLASWDVNAQTNFGVSPLPPTTNAANLTVVGLTRGSGVLAPGGAAARAWGGTSWDSANAVAAAAAGDYATLSITANSGYQVSFNAITKFDYRRSTTGPASGVLQYQVGTGAFTDITSLTYPTIGSGASLTAIDLSGIGALQNIAANNPVTFRIVNYGASGAGGTWYIYDTASNTDPDFAISGIVSSITASNPPAQLPVLTNAAVSGSQFQFLLTGTTGSNYIVQATTDLGISNWISLRTNAAPFTFVESNVFTLPQRLYRGLVAP